MPKRVWKKPLVLSAAATAFAMLVAESGYRAWLGWLDSRTSAAFANMDKPPSLPPGQEADLVHIVRRAKSPRIVYELIPNLRNVTFLGAELSTNRDGFRGPECPGPKLPRSLRIVGLGDSIQFGWGVPEADCMFRRLERRLREHFAGYAVDVINTCVPGYNTAMEVATLEEKCLHLQPDVVIIDYCGNDTDLPNMIWRERDYFTLSHSYLWDHVKLAFSGDRDPWSESPFQDPGWNPEAGRFEFKPERVPAMYRDMVGPAAWRRAMERLVELGKKQGFSVLVTAHWDVNDMLEGTCSDLGLPLIRSYDRLQAYMREHCISTYLGSELTYSNTDHHPSSKNYEIQADTVFEYLQTNGMLKAWAERKG